MGWRVQYSVERGYDSVGYISLSHGYLIVRRESWRGPLLWSGTYKNQAWALIRGITIVWAAQERNNGE